MFGLTGPLFYYEVLRQARKGRGHALRGAYAAFVLFGIAVVYAMNFGWSSLFDYHLVPQEAMSKQLSAFADHLAMAFLVMQGIAVTVLTPACMAGSIVEEKEQGTLQLLYTTHLTEGDILTGKLLGRLAPIMEMLLAGVPLICLLQLLGGLPFNLTAAMFVATVAAAVNYACLSLLASAMSYKVIEAIFMSIAYLMAVFFLMGMIAYFLTMVFGMFPAVFGMGPVRNARFGFLGEEYISPVTLLFGLEQTQLKTGSFGWACFGQLGLFVVLQLASGAVFFLLAWRRMRKERKAERFQRVVREGRWRSRQVEEVVTAPMVSLVLEEPTPSANDIPAIPVAMLVAEPRRRRRRRRRREYDEEDFMLPPAKGDPLVWKEVEWNRLLPESQTIFSVLYLVGGACLLLLIFGVAGFGALAGGRTQFYQSFAAGALSFLGIPMTLLLCGMSGYRAASCILRERAMKTWDSLLTMPVPRTQVLLAKFKGCLITLKPLWIGALLVWVVAGLILAVPVHASPLLIVHIAVVALFLTVLGLWLSLRCQTLLQAQVQMGVWLVIQFLVLWPFGLSPLSSWWFLIFDSNKVHRANFAMEMIGVVVSMIVWAGLGSLLWYASLRRMQGT